MNDSEIDFDYDPGLNIYVEFKINNSSVSLCNFTHDTIFREYCVIGISLSETDVRHRSYKYGKGTFPSWDLISDNNTLIRKKIQTLGYYLARNNLPYDIATLICDMSASNDDLLSPIRNDPFWKKLVKNTIPGYYVIQDDCHCCSSSIRIIRFSNTWACFNCIPAAR